MGFGSIINTTRKYSFAIISVIFMFCNDSVIMLEIPDEDVDNLLAVFDRPLEPLERRNANKNIPLGYSLSFDAPRIGPIPGNEVLADEIQIPGIEDILAFDDREEFSVFIPKHVKLSSKLIDIFLGARDYNELLSLVASVYGKINPYLLMYAYSIALMHRPDTEGIQIPNQAQMFPDKYFNKEVFLPARKEVALRLPFERKPIDIPFEHTGTDLDREHRVAYWREDIALNSHHWHWHMAYPFTGNFSVIKKDRRGELFYYMHRQIIARYNFERLSNNLERVEKLSNWYAPIKEAYFPKLDSFIAKGIYPSRPQNMIFDDIKITMQDIQIDIADIVRIRDRIFKAIDLGYAEGDDGEKVTLDDITGIDILGNIIESSDLSPNPQYYGNMHGSGHLLCAYIHDPKHHHLESMGVMGDVATAMRDPVFYRWHSYVDDIFLRFKGTLPPYTFEQLDYPGVKVTALNVRIEDEQENVFHTFWQKTDVNLINGLDFAEKTGEIYVRYNHLNHQDFNFEIIVENEDQKIKKGVCRIFMSPSGDESGKRWEKFIDQRNMFIELDKFKVTLEPGTNFITRKSVDSTVTISFNETFHQYKNQTRDKKNKHVYSGCGWPHHLMIPKGLKHGFPSQLFVMISNYGQDKVRGSKSSNSESYCGVKSSQYPDKKAMGFPFDRLPRMKVETLEEFLTPNMFVQGCVIVHHDVIVN